MRDSKLLPAFKTSKLFTVYKTMYIYSISITYEKFSKFNGQYYGILVKALLMLFLTRNIAQHGWK